MFLKYQAENEPEVLYEFRPGRTPRNRAVIAEKLYSRACGERRTWEQLKADAQQGSITARSVALWIAMTDIHPLLRFEDIPNFETGQLTLEYSREELRQMRSQLERNSTMLDAEKAAVLEQLAREIEEAPVGSDEPIPAADPEIEEPEEGKADETGEASMSSETSTG